MLELWQPVWHLSFKMKQLLCVFLLLLAGCTFHDSTQTIDALNDRSLTPEAAARKTVSCLSEHAEGGAVQVRDQVPYAAGLLILFTATCPAPDDPATRYDVVDYAVVEQQGLWATRFSNWSGEGRQPMMAVLSGQGGQAGHQIFYGRTLNADVAVVEVRLGSGQQHDLPITNQVFHLVLSGADPLCRLRALAADGTVLEQLPLLPESNC